MQPSTSLLPKLIDAIADVIEKNAAEVTALDQAIGDGDHITNLQRGIAALRAQSESLTQLDWSSAWQKIGMTLMSSVGGASGSLYGTFFIALSKAAGNKKMNLETFADVFGQGVEAVKRRGKAEAGEKTMLDVLVPVAESLHRAAAESTEFSKMLEEITRTADAGAEATREMLPKKGRASFLGERAVGHVDPGAKTSALIIGSVAAVLSEGSTAPA